MKENIFLDIEKYLENPSSSRAVQIKKTSSLLTQEAYKLAYYKREAYLKKKGSDEPIEISADDYQPILMVLIARQAQEAFPDSMRLIRNTKKISPADPKFIFKLSQSQAERLRTIKGELLSRSSNNSPDGFIFAFNGYIERVTQTPYREASQFEYSTESEALIYDHLAVNYSKGKKLLRDKEYDAADVLLTGCKEIKNIDKNDRTSIRAILRDMLSNPYLQNHRGIKQGLVNFLFSISGVGLIYLAATANSRGSFWYRPQTKSENIVDGFRYALLEP